MRRGRIEAAGRPQDKSGGFRGFLELPPDEYAGTVRLKVADNTVNENLEGWDLRQWESCRKYAPVAGAWKGIDFAASNAGEDKPISLTREAGGRLSPCF